MNPLEAGQDHAPQALNSEHQRWLDTATRGLWEPAVRHITQETGEHLRDALHRGASPEEGLAELGDARAARKAYRKVHLTDGHMAWIRESADSNIRLGVHPYREPVLWAVLALPLLPLLVYLIEWTHLLPHSREMLAHQLHDRSPAQLVKSGLIWAALTALPLLFLFWSHGRRMQTTPLLLRTQTLLNSMYFSVLGGMGLIVGVEYAFYLHSSATEQLRWANDTGRFLKATAALPLTVLFLCAVFLIATKSLRSRWVSLARTRYHLSDHDMLKVDGPEEVIPAIRLYLFLTSLRSRR